MMRKQSGERIAAPDPAMYQIVLLRAVKRLKSLLQRRMERDQRSPMQAGADERGALEVRYNVVGPPTEGGGVKGGRRPPLRGWRFERGRFVSQPHSCGAAC